MKGEQSVEKFVHIESDHERLVGVWTDPERGMPPVATVITLHGWGGYRVGPHSFMVKLCRALAREGISSLRFDFRGRGDSTGDQAAATLDTMIDDTCRAVDYARRRAGERRIVLWGLCSGGNVALGAATLAPEVRDLILLSTLPFIPQKKASEKIARAQQQAGNYFRKLFRPATWKKLVTGAVNFRAVRKALLGSAGKSDALGRDPKDSARDVMAAFEKYSGQALFFYGGADREAADARGHYEQFASRHGIPVTFEIVEGANHDFYSLAWEKLIIERTILRVKNHAG